MKKRVKRLVYDEPGKGRKKFKCAYCKAVKYKIKSRIKMNGSKFDFCGRTCKSQAQKTGGVLASKQAGKSKHYRAKALRHYPNVCNRCGFKRRKDILQVHHKDHDRTNDHISNLEVVCPNCHITHHMGGSKRS